MTKTQTESVRKGEIVKIIAGEHDGKVAKVKKIGSYQGITQCLVEFYNFSTALVLPSEVYPIRP